MCNIGDVKIENRAILAPMAGITDLPYRLICKAFGAGLVCSEMISAKGMMYNNENTKELLRTKTEESPLSVQIFGSEPDILGDIAERLREHPCEILDINMGCPVPKIVKNGEGSALMKNPDLVFKIVSSVVKGAGKPVTVKIRKGFDKSTVNAVEIAKVIEAAGASAVCVHGRTRSEFYLGAADWEIIRQVKEAVKIPVIGNGDVVSGETAKKMLSETGCDFVMVGRAAEGNPWIFQEIRAYLNSEKWEPPTLKEKIDMAIKHARSHISLKGERQGVLEMRKHLCWYLKGIKGSGAAKLKINKAQTLSEIEEILSFLL